MYIVSEDKKLKMLKGDVIQVNKYIILRQYSLNEILENRNEYYNLLGLIVDTPFERKVSIWDNLKIYWTQISHWQLFLNNFESNRAIVSKAFEKFCSLDISNFVFGKIKNIQESEVNESDIYDNLFICNKDKTIIIDKDIFYEIVNLLRFMNGRSIKEEFEMVGRKKDDAIEKERRTLKYMAQGRRLPKHDFASMVSSVWHIKGGNIENIYNLKPYQIFNIIDREKKFNEYDELMDKINSGLMTKQIMINNYMWFNKV